MSNPEPSTREILLRTAREQYSMGVAEEERGEHEAASASYRIAANTYSTLIEAAERERDHARWRSGLINQWAREALPRVAPTWSGAPPIPYESIRNFVIDRALTDPQLSQYFAMLDEGLAEAGVIISSPGGSLQRHLIYLLSTCVGQDKRNDYETALANPLVRIALERFAAELISTSDRGRGTGSSL